MPEKDGSSKREHLESIQEQTGKPIPDLDIPPMPAAGIYIKYMFDKLQIGRQGLKPFSYQDLYYFCKMTNETLTDFELASLKVLDAVYLNKVNEIANAGTKT